MIRNGLATSIVFYPLTLIFMLHLAKAQPVSSSPYVVEGDRFVYDVKGHVTEREHFGSGTSSLEWDEHQLHFWLHQPPKFSSSQVVLDQLLRVRWMLRWLHKSRGLLRD